MDSKGENEKAKGRPFVSNIIGTSPRIQEVLRLIEKVADSPLSVLITGESGTGKELAARTIHINSPRSNKPFIDINCAALPESLLESELFGIEKGVATGVEKRVGKIETASGGTLFLDEIGDMSLSAQAKLLRVLQERKLERVGGRSTINVDVRVLAATNKDLKSEIEKGSFRKDLYYRLNAAHIVMPALHDMKDDIPLLAEHFLKGVLQYAPTSEGEKGSMCFSAEAMDCLVNYGWPGNVRELENEVKRAAILAERNTIEESNLSEHVRGIVGAGLKPAPTSEEGVLQYAPTEERHKFLRGTVEEIEIQRIKDALEKTGGNKQKAAKILGLTRTGLIYKIKKYGLSAETKLKIKCQSCGKENSLNNKLCSGCGHKLSGTTKSAKRTGFVARGSGFGKELQDAEPVKAIKLEQPQSYIPKHSVEKIPVSKVSLEGERKEVTVLFASMHGFTGLSEGLDPEEMRTLTNRCFEIIMEEVHRYEGIINQFTGDGVMALFGAPIALEDHPYRAVSSALAIQRSVNKYGNELKERGINLRIRIGISTGLVVVGSIGNNLKMDYTAIGDIINLASRLEGLAEPGTILTSENTYRLVRQYFSVKPLGELKVKGEKITLKAYRVFGPGRSTAPLDIARERGLTTFVGREKEVDILRDRLTRAIGRFGQAVAIFGEAGLGKSRLIYEFRRSIEREKITYIEATCLSYGKSIPYLPVIGILKSNFRVEATDDESIIKEKFATGIRKMGDGLEWTLPYFYHLLSLRGENLKELDEREIKRKTYEAIKAITLRGSQLRPLVLVIENVHWMDSASEEFLNYLVGNIARGSTMMIVSSRPGYVPTFTDKSYYTQLTLSPLSGKDCDTMLRGLLKADNIPAGLRELVLSKCEGNPFYLEEVVKDFLEEGVIRQVNEKYVLSKEASKLRVPGTIHNVIMSRVDRLNENLKRTLQYASVIGREFPLGILKEITGIGEEIHEHIERLKGLELIYEKGIYPETEYLFKHALTQETAYNSLLLSKRKELHGSIGGVLEEQYPKTAETQPELLAYHYTEAGIGGRAIPYWQKAGLRARQRSANVEAIGHFTKGLELLKTLPDTSERTQQELTLQISLGAPLRAVKGFAAPEVEKVYTRAREICQQIGETSKLFSVLRGLCGIYIARPEYQKARELGEQYLQQAQSVQDSALLIQAHYLLAATLFCLGEIPLARKHAEQGIILYDPQQHSSHAFLYGQDPGVGCLFWAACALWNLGYPDQALKRSYEALNLAQELDHPFSLALGQYSVALIHQFRREVQTLQGWAKAMIALSTEQEFEFFLKMGNILHGWALAEQGQREEGIMQIRQGLAALRAQGTELFWTYWLTLLTEAYERVGQAEEGLVALAESLDVANKNGERFYEAELYRLKGELLLMQTVGAGLKPAPTEEAETCFRQAIDVARRQSAKSLELRAAISLSRLWQGQGRKEEARQMLSEICGWFTEGFDTKDLKEAKALLEELC